MLPSYYHAIHIRGLVSHEVYILVPGVAFFNIPRSVSKGVRGQGSNEYLAQPARPKHMKEFGTPLLLRDTINPFRTAVPFGDKTT